MADRPIAELGDQTPLSYAYTPEMDQLAAVSEIGMVHTIPEGRFPMVSHGLPVRNSLPADHPDPDMHKQLPYIWKRDHRLLL